MAYADRQDSGNKVVAIIIVALIHAVIGYAFVTGLAYQYVKKVSEKLNTFDVAPPPPPPPDEPPPPPPPDTPLTPPPVVSPPPIVRNPNPPPIQIQTVNTPPANYNPVPIAAPPAPPAPPAAPPAPRQASAATPRGNPANWFSEDYYPPAAKRAGIEGRVSVSLSVGADGRVADCRVTSSSGNADLDEVTCRLAKRSGRYNPAKDDAGNAIASTVRIPSVRWTLREE